MSCCSTNICKPTLRPDKVVKWSSKAFQLSSDQRKQVTRLAERVYPGHPMLVVVGFALGGLIAIGQQHGIAVFIADNRGGEFRHHVGAV